MAISAWSLRSSKDISNALMRRLVRVCCGVPDGSRVRAFSHLDLVDSKDCIAWSNSSLLNLELVSPATFAAALRGVVWPLGGKALVVTRSRIFWRGAREGSAGLGRVRSLIREVVFGLVGALSVVLGVTGALSAVLGAVVVLSVVLGASGILSEVFGVGSTGAALASASVSLGLILLDITLPIVLSNIMILPLTLLY